MCVYSRLPQCLLAIFSVSFPRTPKSQTYGTHSQMELHRPPGHSRFLSGNLPWTILQGQIESLGKNSNTHFSSTSQDTCLQIFPINYEVIVTRNSSKGQPDLLRIAPILKKQFNYHNRLCRVASKYRGWSRALNSCAPVTGQAPST